MAIKTVAARKSIKDGLLTIEVDVPGYKKETLELSVRGDLRGYTIIEGLVGKGSIEDVRDEFALVLEYDPRMLDTSTVTASLADGVLVVKIPVAAAFLKHAVIVE